MAHHLSGMSNSAKRRAALAENQNDHHEDRHGMFAAMQSRFGSLCTMGKEKAVEMEHAAEQSIQQRPLLAVVIGIGVGMLLGAVSTMACQRTRD